jgi:tetratricopeptide (TPR) repeat protein
MSPRASFVVLALLVSLAACTKTPAAQMRDGLAKVEQEHDPERLLRAGKAYALLGDASRAAQYYQLAIDNGGDENTIFPLLLEVCVRDKQYRAAIYYGQNQLRRHPDDVALRFLVASLHGAMGDAKTARALLEDVLKSAPENPEAHYALAVLLRDEEADLTSADQHFREYLKLMPAGPHADEARGALLQGVP